MHASLRLCCSLNLLSCQHGFRRTRGASRASGSPTLQLCPIAEFTSEETARCVHSPFHKRNAPTQPALSRSRIDCVSTPFLPQLCLSMCWPLEPVRVLEIRPPSPSFNPPSMPALVSSRPSTRILRSSATATARTSSPLPNSNATEAVGGHDTSHCLGPRSYTFPFPCSTI